jgi:hypothetical protein
MRNSQDKEAFIEDITRIEVSLVKQGYSLVDIERIEIDSLDLIRKGDESSPEAYLRAIAQMVRKDMIQNN